MTTVVKRFSFREVQRAVALVLTVFAGWSCKHADPPSFDGGPGFSPSAVPLGASGPASAAAASAPRDAGGPDAGAVADDDEEEDAGALPQTHDKPEASGAAFDARVHALFDAIVSDDAERAMPFFFPLAAYEQVKAIQHPARDWHYRLVAAYVRDIHDLHREVGAGATFVSIDVPSTGRWVDPGEEYNKIGYFRVYGSVIKYTRAGHEHTFRITSMISWRGEWYVVHLGAIQ